MKKFQLFLVIEGLLLAMAFMTILENDLYSFLLLSVLALLALRFYNLEQRQNFLLTSGLLLLFLIFMLNPFVIMAVLLGLVYMMFNYFAQVKTKNRLALIEFRDQPLAVQPLANQWLGAGQPLRTDAYAFDDINIIRVSGSDVIDLEQVIVSGRDNVILIRKIYGPTLIRVPIDVAVSLNVSSIYGTVAFFDLPEYDLRNESLKLEEDSYASSHRTVKVVVNVLAGRVGVVRR